MFSCVLVFVEVMDPTHLNDNIFNWEMIMTSQKCQEELLLSDFCGCAWTLSSPVFMPACMAAYLSPGPRPLTASHGSHLISLSNQAHLAIISSSP